MDSISTIPMSKKQRTALYMQNKKDKERRASTKKDHRCAWNSFKSPIDLNLEWYDNTWNNSEW